MKGDKVKMPVMLITALVFTISTISVVYADSISEKVQAYLGVSIQYNGQYLAADKQPYIINDTTYVPLRMLMNNFDKDISYDAVSKIVLIKDRENSSAAGMNNNIDDLNSRIAILKSQVNKLQSENSTVKSQNEALLKENKELSTKITTLNNRIAALEDYNDELSDIEDGLYDDYADAGDDYLNDDDVDFSITLYGDEDYVEFEIYLDFSDSNKNYDMEDVSITYIKNLMKAIYDDLKDALEDSKDYEDADITGITIDDSGNEIEYDGKRFYPNSW